MYTAKAEIWQDIFSIYFTDDDHASIGMRCGAATYEILGQLGILKGFSLKITCLKILYPKKLRQRLFAKAIQNKCTIVRQEGSTKRNGKD